VSEPRGPRTNSCPRLQADAVGALFDHWVGSWLPAAREYPPERFIELIEELKDWALDLAGKLVASPDGWSRGPSPLVRARILSRKAFWTAEALRVAREAEVARRQSEAATAGGVSQQASETEPSTSEVPVPGDATVRAVPSSTTAAPEPNYPRRAEWLQQQLDERRWTVNDLERLGGPDRRTTRRILDGRAVKQNVLEKLVQVLSLKRRVTVRDIPTD
jgi:hypothetical protein